MSLPIPLLAVLASSPPAEWTSPPGCPGLDAVLAEARRQGAELDDEPVDLRGSIEPIDGGYALHLTIDTASGTTRRTVRTDSCEPLARAAGLMLAVALDPLRVPAPPSPADPEAEPPPVEVAPSPEPPLGPQPRAEPGPGVEPGSSTEPSPDAADAARPAPAVDGVVIASGTLGRGITPAIDGRVQLGLGLDAPRVRAELLGFHAFAQTARFAQQPEIGARVLGWGGSVRAGPRFTWGWLELACPVGVELAVVVGQGFGTDQTWQRADLRWGPLVAPGVRARLGPWVALGVDVELDVALRRPAFALEPLGDVHRTPRLGARGGARLELRFPTRRRDQDGRRRRP
ncbi:MAG: hypothetical protein KDK70_36270 [Myxococcales bacterium]|nr:hypothetical protein [Myxococcales bacterium]